MHHCQWPSATRAELVTAPCELEAAWWGGRGTHIVLGIFVGPRLEQRRDFIPSITLGNPQQHRLPILRHAVSVLPVMARQVRGTHRGITPHANHVASRVNHTAQNHTSHHMTRPSTIAAHDCVSGHLVLTSLQRISNDHHHVFCVIATCGAIPSPTPCQTHANLRPIPYPLCVPNMQRHAMPCHAPCYAACARHTCEWCGMCRHTAVLVCHCPLTAVDSQRDSCIRSAWRRL